MKAVNRRRRAVEMRWLARFAVVSMSATLAWGVLAVVLINARREEVIDQVFSPAFTLCDWVTPDEWQTLGNIPLGLFWIATAIALYGIATGVVICIANDFWRSRGFKSLAEPTRAAALARKHIPETL
jgi:hypothetical protein